MRIIKYNICIHTSCVLSYVHVRIYIYIYMKMFEANDSMISMASILIIYISLYMHQSFKSTFYTPSIRINNYQTNIYISTHYCNNLILSTKYHDLLDSKIQWSNQPTPWLDSKYEVSEHLMHR